MPETRASKIQAEGSKEPVCHRCNGSGVDAAYCLPCDRCGGSGVEPSHNDEETLR